MKSLSMIAVFLSLFFIISCGDSKNESKNDDESTNDENVISDDDSLIEGKYKIEGFVQKGPFVQGSEITIAEIDSGLVPIGTSYTTSTIDDFGSFEISKEMSTNYVEVTASGYYFNEVEGKLSTSELSFRVVSDLTEEKPVNINILTTIERERIKVLIGEGKTFEEARSQAETEILAVFNIKGFETDNFQEMDISKEGDSNAMLLAISAVLQHGNTEAELSELISKITQDIKDDGILDGKTQKDAIKENGMALDLAAVRTNLEQRYSDLGLVLTIPEFEDFIDSDGDGLINRYDFTIEFETVENADLDKEYDSNEITVILPPDIAQADATLDNGILVINGVELSESEKVSDGDKVKIRLKSSSTHGGTSKSNLKIDYSPYEVPGTFEIISKSEEYFELNFTAVNNADLIREYTSNEQTVALPDSIPDASATIDNGEIIVNGESKGKSATVVDGDKVAVKLLSSDKHGETVTAELSVKYLGIAGIKGAFAVNASTSAYFNLDFEPVKDADLDMEYTSNEIEITLPDEIADTDLTVDKGSLIINGTDKGKTATAVDGDKIAIKYRSSPDTYGKAETVAVKAAYLEKNDVNGSFSITAPNVKCGEVICVDRVYDLEWQKNIPETHKKWSEAISYCENLEYDAKTDWRLPNINELRTLIINCPDSEFGGKCEVYDPLQLSTSNDCQSCFDMNDPTPSTDYSAIGNEIGTGNEYGKIWSISEAEGFDNLFAWTVSFGFAQVGSEKKDDIDIVVFARCVRGEELLEEGEDPESQVYKDPDTNFEWMKNAVQNSNPLSPETYCDDLVLEGKDDWRLPTISELRTIIKDDPALKTGGTCLVTDECTVLNNCGMTPGCDTNYGGPNVCIFDTANFSFVNTELPNTLSSTVYPDGRRFVLSFCKSPKGITYLNGPTYSGIIRCVRN